ncbi:low molecular weight protein-tyrosine-phosphatase [Salibaculum sp.]|uniref:low molecular weight protein-tyrosine-phosphatase n=1 Tax=Salibaculum sp. TaxID=2855480 RepID=UPI002B48EF5A|nr:low molecular weight protein-tyrosine-phosphatase [Salibaculum sp.]HKL69777.1 low molecular weight protein-tyrosine-phosphatase [Salibaculum sp.]
MTRVLFVCLGNICRSPAAEGVVRSRLPDLGLDSAGTGGWHVGAPPYGPMQAAARARGHDLSDLRARQFDPSDFEAFELIFAMDAANLRDIEAQRPPGNATRVENFAELAGAAEVPDPYYTRDFEGCLDLIEACAEALSRRFAVPR